jgi:DNA-binding NarL/FixJ family response regulator
VDYGRLAAVQAKSAGAYDEAISHFEAVLGLLPSQSVEATELQVELGQVQMRKGHAFKAQGTYNAAFEAARRNGWAEQAARAALGYEEAVHQPGAPGGPAVRMVSEAIRLIGDQQGPLRVHLQASLSRSLYLAGDQHAAISRRPGVVDGSSDRRPHEPHRRVASAHGCVGRIAADARGQHRVARRVDAHRRQLERRLRDGNHVQGVRPARSDRRGHRGAEATSHVGRSRTVPRFQFMADVYDALLALAAGQFDEAEQAAERAHALGYASDTVFDAGVYGLQMFAIRREQGRLAEVLPLMRSLSARADDEPIWRPGLTVLYAELGMIDDARRELEALAPGGFAIVPRDSVWPGCLTFLVEACIACGEVAYAEFLLKELDHYAGHNLMVAMTICFGPTDRLRGGLAHLLGRLDEADEHFRAAMALADRSESPVWRAHVHHDWGALALARGDTASAHQLARQALDTATALKMGTLAQRAASLLERTEATPVAEKFDGLSERELDVLRLIAEGCSNREIGDRLFISQHTAANHVRSILQKTGCANRAEAAAYAVLRRVVHK